MRAIEFISKEIFEEIEAVGFVSKFIKGTYTEIDGILYDLHIPTYSEVFAWFRYNHNIFACVKDEVLKDGIIYFEYYFRHYMKTYISNPYDCYEAAEEAVLEYIMNHFRVMIEDRKREILLEKELIEFD